MLDARFVRENLDLVETAMQNRNFAWDSTYFIDLDEKRRAAIAEEEALQAKRNSLSKEIGALMAAGKPEEAEATKAQVAELKDALEALSAAHAEAEDALYELLMGVPNIPHETTPVGKDETENPEVRRWGTPRELTLKRRHTGTWVLPWA